MLSTNVGTNVGHVFRSVSAIGAVEPWHLATLELGVIIKIVLVAEDARARRAWKLLLLAVRGHGRFLKARTPSSGAGRVAEICRLKTHWNRNDTWLGSDEIMNHARSVKFSMRFDRLFRQFSMRHNRHTLYSCFVRARASHRSTKGKDRDWTRCVYTR